MPEKFSLKVEGMHCNSCATLVTDALSEIGAKEIDVKVVKGGLSQVSFVGDKTRKEFSKAIEAEGYGVK